MCLFCNVWLCVCLFYNVWVCVCVCFVMCVCVFCDMWVFVFMGFVMCWCVYFVMCWCVYFVMCWCVYFVMCWCFGNMCTCIYSVFLLFCLCIIILLMLLFTYLSYAFLSFCLCILIVMYVLFCIFCFLRVNWHSSATLTKVFCAFSSVVRKMPGYNSQRWGTARTLPKLIVFFYVLFVFKCVLYYCHRMSTHFQLTNLSISDFVCRDLLTFLTS